MGRVRSYKKIKACDPFAKRSKREVDTVHDEPPEIYEEKARRDAKRKERPWDTDDAKERELQREARRVLRETERTKHVSSQKKIEGKRDDESMRDFKVRIRQETRMTLKEAVTNNSATSIKRKERLKDRKLKREGKPARVARVDEEEGFSSAANGRLRASDMGGRDDFARPEVVRFGDRSERPPDLKNLVKFAEKPMRKQQEQRRLQPAAPSAQSSSSASSSYSSASATSSSAFPPPKRKKTPIAEVAGMDGDALHAPSAVGRGAAGALGGIIHAGDGSGKTSASFAEMAALRERVQQAYKKVQQKRREAHDGRGGGY